MKIVILGAGQVGSTLAENLANEANDITLVDTESERLAELRDRLDIKTVSGLASHPQVLEDAGIQDADLLVAVTSSDEVNLVACMLAHTIFHTPKKIARIRSSGYTNDQYVDRIFSQDYFSVDVITPEQLVTEHLERLVGQPGALQVLDFADEAVQLVGVRAIANAPMVGEKIRALRDHIPDIDSRVAAVYRRGKAIIPEGETIIEQGDEVFFLAASRHLRSVVAQLAGQVKPYKRIIIAGGGNIGFRLASALEDAYQVKLIELSTERCQFLAENLSKTVVLDGSSSDQDLLLEEGIDSTDVFLAVTNNDAANIMSSMLAKRLGAGKVITIINNPVYVDLMQASVIDIAISPEQITTSSLLSYVRKGDTVKVHTLRRGAAEAMEVIAHGDKQTSRVVGRMISEIALPAGATIGAIVRLQDKKPVVLMGHHDVLIEDGDHLILFLIDKHLTKKIEQLFQPVRFLFK